MPLKNVIPVNAYAQQLCPFLPYQNATISLNCVAKIFCNSIASLSVTTKTYRGS
jgi:hypothetical protein